MLVKRYSPPPSQKSINGPTGFRFPSSSQRLLFLNIVVIVVGGPNPNVRGASEVSDSSFVTESGTLFRSVLLVGMFSYSPRTFEHIGIRTGIRTLLGTRTNFPLISKSKRFSPHEILSKKVPSEKDFLRSRCDSEGPSEIC